MTIEVLNMGNIRRKPDKASKEILKGYKIVMNNLLVQNNYQIR